MEIEKMRQLRSGELAEFRRQTLSDLNVLQKSPVRIRAVVLFLQALQDRVMGVMWEAGEEARKSEGMRAVTSPDDPFWGDRRPPQAR